MREIALIAHNLRSNHNVGSLLRTADGLGIQKVFLTGYTPHPPKPGDTRLPHLSARALKDISKTALGAEESVDWEHHDDVFALVAALRRQGWQIMALEQTADSTPLPDFQPSDKIVVIVGREVEGMEGEVLAVCDGSIEIPMFGVKESFNVVQAAAIALYALRIDG